MSADNQQERLKTVGWIVGLVDGEGCFSIAIQRNRTMNLGWQVFPEFVVTQGLKSRQALEVVQNYFDCGSIYLNSRLDNHNEALCRYCVRARSDLSNKIIPFFTENPPRTAKRDDFGKFKQVIDLMNDGNHLSFDGLKRIARIAQTMNRRKPSKFLESSETIRQNPVQPDKI